MERQTVALTTIDNPYDYFTQFEQWFLFDVEKGYNTCAYLGRTVQLEEGMTQIEEDREVERAIDAIIKQDFLNIYKKITKPL